MDANVKVLMDATGCTETEAQNALRDVGGDVSKAMKMLDAGSKEVMVFQVGFNAGEAKVPGYLIAALDISSNSLVAADMAHPLTQDQAKMIDINMPPTVFASTIKNVKSRLSERHQSAGRGNLSNIKSKLSHTLIQTIISMNQKGQKDAVNEKLAQVISGALGESVVVRSFARAHALDSITAALGNGGPASVTPESKAAQLFKTPEKTSKTDIGGMPSATPQEALPKIALICEPELSPYEGRPAAELLEGDKVIVKIKDGRDSARYFSELLGGSIKDQLIPLCVPIVKIDKVSDTFVEAYVEFGPGIYGQFFIPPGARVKTAGEGVELYNPFQDEESLFADNRMGRKLLIELGVLIAASVCLIIVFLYLGLG